MASIYELNQPPRHPFWDMLANIQNHPLFGPGPYSAQAAAGGEGACPEQDEPAQNPGAGAWGYGYPHPYGFGFGFGDPFSGVPYPTGPRFGGGWGGPGPGAPPHRGRGRGRGSRGCHPGHHGHTHGHGHHHNAGQSNTNAGETAQNIASFIQAMATNLGISFDQIFPHGLNPHTANQRGGQGDQADFTPPIDIIDTPAEYIVHVSLPGAKKDDLSVEYDGTESVLRVAGVVYRPGVDEEMHAGLVVEERKKEVGVLERLVRLGTAERPAGVDVQGIVGMLEDGVLRVFVPKMKGGEVTGKKMVIEDDEEEGGSGSETVGETGEYVRVKVQLSRWLGFQGILSAS